MLLQWEGWDGVLGSILGFHCDILFNVPFKTGFDTSFLLNPDFSMCPKMGSSVSIYLSPMFNSLVDIFWIQGVLYGSVGFGCGLIGQGIANMIMNAKRYASIRIIILLIYPKIYIYILHVSVSLFVCFCFSFPFYNFFDK